MLPLFLLFLSVPPLLTHATQIQLNVYHRIQHPATQQAPFSLRGTILISPNNTATYQSSATFPNDLETFGDALASVSNPNLALYQIALDLGHDSSETQWDTSSVKACHLYQSTSEAFYLHSPDLYTIKPHAIDYFLAPTPHDGACPKFGKHKPPGSSSHIVAAFQQFAKNTRSLNTTVYLKASHFPPHPQLVAPPPVTAEGEPIIPEPEKSFLQKYWMYIVIFLLAMMLSGGPEEERPAPRR